MTQTEETDIIPNADVWPNTNSIFIFPDSADQDVQLVYTCAATPCSLNFSTIYVKNTLIVRPLSL